MQSDGSTYRFLDGRSGPLVAVAAALVLATVPLSGCVSPVEDLTGQSADEAGDDVTEQAPDEHSTARGWSQPQQPAEYDVLPGQKFTLGSFDQTRISVAVFLPDIEGCDWNATDLPEECQVPVVMDAGPYWADVVDDRSYRPPLVEWLVPRGIAVAHMSIRGTGESEGCMEFMSMNEQRDVSEAIDWLADQPWSTGKVGMMGRSYDGTTPLMGAALDNPNLETIVPIAGVWDVPDLMFKNGTSEFRGPVMHSVVYWTLFGLGAIYGPDAAEFRSEHWADQACEEFLTGAVEGPRASATGNTDANYWEERRFTERIVEDFDGSVWIVHGMRDWNVNPSQVVPAIDRLKDDGVPTKAWLGQWDHAYPDRVDEHRNARWDWATKTVQWFEYWLEGEGEQPELNVDVEDHLFVWREEETYPPEDSTTRTLELSADRTLAEPGEAEAGSFVVTGPPSGAAGPVGASADGESAGSHAVFASEPLEEDVRIAGLPNLHVTAVPSTPEGGQLFAELYDEFPDGQRLRVGWAAMDLRYHDGGNTDPATLTPGEPVDVKMQFEPADAHVAEGHRLVLEVDKAGVEDVLPQPDPQSTKLQLGDGRSELLLPTVDRPDIVEHPTPPSVDDVEDTDGGR